MTAKPGKTSFRIRPSCLFALGAAFLFALKSAHGYSQWDLQVYLDAARSVWAGENPYYDPIEEASDSLTLLTVYVYPPIFARILSPLTVFSDATLKMAWMVLQAISFEALFFLGLRLFGKSCGLVPWALFHLVAVYHDGVETDFRAGNTALLEAAAMTAWATFHLRNPILSGTWFGILLAIKPLTLFVTLWDLERKRWVGWLAILAVGGGLTGMMALDQPLFGYYRAFLDTDTFQEIMDEHTVGIYNNATVSVAFRLFTDKTIFVPLYSFPALAYVLTFAVPLAALLAAFSAWRRMDESALPEEERNAVGFLLALPTALLITPRVADYTLVWLLVPFFFGIWKACAERRLGPTVLFLLAGAIGSLPITGGQLNEDTFELHLLHFRYLSLCLFWFAAWRLARRDAES